MTSGKSKRSSRDKRTICVIQHVACETPGLIADMLQSGGFELRFARPFKGDRIPKRIGDHAGLLVMGGPMGVYEQTSIHSCGRRSGSFRMR